MPQRPVDIVADFYTAISNSDADTVASTIDAHFAEDAAIEWPPSLPHGGRVEGSRKLRAIFTAIAKPGAPAGATNLKLVRAIGDDVVAWLTFDWKQPGSDVGTPKRRTRTVELLQRSITRHSGALLGHRLDRFVAVGKGK